MGRNRQTSSTGLALAVVLLSSCDNGLLSTGSAVVEHADEVLAASTGSDLPKNARSAVHVQSLAIGETVVKNLEADLVQAGLTSSEAAPIVTKAKESMVKAVGALVLPESGFSLTADAAFQPIYVVSPAIMEGAVDGLDDPAANLGSPERIATFAGISLTSGFESLNGNISKLDNAGISGLAKDMVASAVKSLGKAGLGDANAGQGAKAITSSAVTAIGSAGIAAEDVVSVAGAVVEGAVQEISSAVSADSADAVNLINDAITQATEGAIEKVKTVNATSGDIGGSISQIAGKMAASSLKGVKTLQQKIAQQSASTSVTIDLKETVKKVSSTAIQVMKQVGESENTALSDSVSNLTKEMVGSLSNGGFANDEIASSAGAVASGALSGMVAAGVTQEDIKSAELISKVMSSAVGELDNNSLSSTEVASAMGEIVSESVASLGDSAFGGGADKQELLDEVLSGTVSGFKDAGISDISSVQIAVQNVTKGVTRSLASAGIEAADVAEVSGKIANTSISLISSIEITGNQQAKTNLKTLASEVTKGVMEGMSRLKETGSIDAAVVSASASSVLDQAVGALNQVKAANSSLGIEIDDLADISSSLVDGAFKGLAKGGEDSTSFSSIQANVRAEIASDLTALGVSAAEISSFEEAVDTAVAVATTLADKIDAGDSAFDKCADAFSDATADDALFTAVADLPDPVFCSIPVGTVCPKTRDSDTFGLSWVLTDLDVSTTSSICELQRQLKEIPFAGAFVLVDAPSHSSNPSTTFNWSASANAKSYRIAVAQGSDCSDPFVVKKTTTTSYTTTALNEGSYVLCVEAENVIGERTKATAGDHLFVIDTTPPTISSFSTASITQVSGGYRIDFSLVGVGAAEVQINQSSDCSGPLGYSAYSTSPSHVVTDAEVASATSTLVPVSARVRDAAGNVSSCLSTIANFGLVFDTVAPTVTAVTTSSANGLYLVGNPIALTIHFSEPVVTAATTPVLALNSGGNATYISGSGTNQLEFAYVPQTGEKSALLDYQSSNALSPQGSITDVAGNPAVLSLPTPGLTGSISATAQIVVDAGGPRVTSVQATNADGTYTQGAVITIQVQFDEVVFLSGTPQLDLALAGSSPATFTGGGSTNTFTFTYTIQSVDNTSDLDYLNTGSLSLTGSMTDNNGNHADLTLPNPGSAQSLGGTSNIVIDNMGPNVLSVTSTTANGVYNDTDTINLVVNFNEPIVVTGTPYIQLQTGGTGFAYFSSTSGTAMNFSYTPVTGNDSTDLDYQTNSSLQLSGGTISDAAGNAAILTLPNPGAAGSLSANADLVIDTTGPTVANVVSSTPNGHYTVGDVIIIDVVFSEPITTTAPVYLQIENGPTDPIIPDTSVSGSTISYTYTVSAGDTSSDLDYLNSTSLSTGGSILDAAGNTGMIGLPTPGMVGSLSNNANIIIDTTAPTIPATIDAHANNQEVKIDWNSSTGATDFLLVRRAGAPVSWSPTTGTAYSVGALDGSHTLVHKAYVFSYTDTGLTNGTTYHYSVFGVDSALNYSPAQSISVQPTVPIKVQSAADLTCALFSNGSVKCWGQNLYGELGSGLTAEIGSAANQMGYNLSPVKLGTGQTATDITVGQYHACAILTGGNVKCWGRNNYGQLGLGDTTDRGSTGGSMGDSLPTVNLGTGRTATKIMAMAEATCAILDNGETKCWGRNHKGQLGLEDASDRGTAGSQMGNNLPAVTLGTGRTAVALDGGLAHICAVLDNADVKCWGKGLDGQLISGSTTDIGYATSQMGDNLSAVDLGTGRTGLHVSGGTSTTCAVLDNGDLKCWGSNTQGMLGQGDTTDRGGSPGDLGDNLTAIDLGTGRTAVSVHAGAFHTCAKLDNGEVKCWGKNLQGQLGQGNTTKLGDGPGEMGDSLPAIAFPTGANPVQITAGANHVCGLFSDDEVRCWGQNGNGQLGIGSTQIIGDGAGEMGDNLGVTDL